MVTNQQMAQQINTFFTNFRYIQHIPKINLKTDNPLSVDIDTEKDT